MTFRWSGSPKSLARQFAVTSAALAGVSALLIALVSWWWIDRLQHDAGEVMQRREAEVRAHRSAEALNRVEHRLRELANSPLLATALTDSLGRGAYLLPFLGGIQAIDGVPVELIVTDFDGKEIARNGDISFTEAERQPRLARLAEGEMTSQIGRGESGDWLLLGAPVIYTRTGTVEGAVWLKLPLTQLLQADGYVLRIGAMSNPAPENTLTAEIALPRSMASLSLHLESQVRPTSHLRAAVFIAPVLGGLLILVVTVSWVGGRLARRLTKDLDGLCTFADGVADRPGGIERAPVKGSTEVASLAESVNRMLDKLHAQHEVLQSESRSRLQLLATCIANLNDVVMITEPDPDHCEGHRIVFVNGAFTKLTGYTSEEVIGRGPKLLQGTDTDPAVLRRIGDGLRQWQSVSAEVKNYTKSGTPYWVKIDVVPVKDETGRVTHWVSVERDTTSSRATDEQLRRSEQDLALALERLELASSMAKVGGWELDVATMQPHWSPETCRIHEVDPPVTPPLERAIEFYAPEALATIQAAVQAAIDHGTPWDLELPLITAKGRRIWVRTQCSCVLEGGKVVVLRGAFHDITERKQAEESLLESKNFSASVIDSLGAQIAVLDAHGVIVAVNEAWRRFAVSNGAAATLDGVGIGVDYLRVCAKAADSPRGEEAGQAQAGIRAVLTGELTDFQLEYPCHSPTEQRWFQLNVAAMKSAAGGAVVSHTSITERMLAESAMRDSEVRYRELFDGNPQPMWVFDVETLAFLAVNTAAVRQYGYSRDEFLAMTIYDIRPPEEAARVRQYLAGVDVSRQDGRLWVHRRKDGSLVQVEITSSGLDYGHRPSRLVLATDVTARELSEAEKARLNAELERHRHHLEDLVVRRTAELAAARQQAEDANRAKSAFLANMSHEIRTPLNAIVGLSFLVRRDPITPAQAARLEKIDAAGQHLLSIINDVLDLSKIEAGRVQIESTNFHLSAVLDQVHSIIAETARAKGLLVEVDGNAVPLWLRGDPTRLRQTLLNFAGNAVKFTERGSIALRAKLMSEQGDELLVRFAVEDSGIGITPEQVPRLFRAFEQADPTITRKFGGTGLGLAISQRLATLMGGECGVESKAGVGSTFWFTARLQRGHGVVQAPSVDERTSAVTLLQQRHRGARILLAEDNPVNLEVALALLHGVGLDVDTAINGREAVRLAADRAYDLVLMDMQMPEMGGLEATRSIRALAGWQTRPILALTANAFDDDRRACAAAGMNDFITKPMEVGSLYGTLLRWLDAGASGLVDAAGVGAQTGS